MKLGIIDYGSGNLHSVEHALVHAGKGVRDLCSIERITSADAHAIADFASSIVNCPK